MSVIMYSAVITQTPGGVNYQIVAFPASDRILMVVVTKLSLLGCD